MFIFFFSIYNFLSVFCYIDFLHLNLIVGMCSVSFERFFCFVFWFVVVLIFFYFVLFLFCFILFLFYFCLFVMFFSVYVCLLVCLFVYVFVCFFGKFEVYTTYPYSFTKYNVMFLTLI